jgi:hypothetical protein
MSSLNSHYITEFILYLTFINLELLFFIMRLNNKGIVSEYLPWILIALAILAIILIAAFLMKGKGFEFIDQLKNLFRGR